MSKQYTNALGLDLGMQKIGVARVNSIARIPEPLITLANDADLFAKLRSLVQEYAVDLLVIGLPRNMNGEETQQTKYTQELASTITQKLSIPSVFQDETLSTLRASEYQRKTGSTASEDAIAACVILEDFIEEARTLSDKIDPDV